MWIPKEVLWFVFGIVCTILPIAFYEIIYDYAAIKELQEEEKKVKTKGWIKRGWNNAVRDWKKKFSRKKRKKKK